MGAGIVEVFARSGVDVVAVEVDEAALGPWSRALDRLDRRAVARGKLSPTRTRRAARPGPVRGRLDAVAGCGPRHRGRTRASRSQAEDLRGAGPDLQARDAILATNTSSLSVTEISVATGRPAPGRRHALLQPGAGDEARRGRSRPSSPTTDVVVDVDALCARSARSVVVNDRAGFIANALLFGYLNHAVSMYEGRYAIREDIDAAMKLGCGLPMGPLALMDLIGLDTAYEILDTMYRAAAATGGTRRRRCSSRWSPPVCSVGRPVGASTRTRTGLAGGRAGRADAELRGVGGGRCGRWRAVGVIGSGTMATGIVEVFAQGRVRGDGRDRGRRRSRPARRGGVRVAGPRPWSGADVRRRPRRGARPGDAVDVARRPRRRRPRRRGGGRGARRQEGAVRLARRDLQAGRHPRHHDVVACR